MILRAESVTSYDLPIIFGKYAVSSIFTKFAIFTKSVE